MTPFYVLPSRPPQQDRALYRVFSSLPPCLCSPTFESAWVDHVSPARPDRRDCRRGHNSTTAHANGDMDGSRGVDLSAFLELCRGADFILSVGNGSNGSTGNGLNCGVRRRNNKNERPWGTRHVEEGQQLQPDFSISVVADVIAGLTAGTRAGETAFHVRQAIKSQRMLSCRRPSACGEKNVVSVAEINTASLRSATQTPGTWPLRRSTSTTMNASRRLPTRSNLRCTTLPSHPSSPLAPAPSSFGGHRCL